jgi:deazaflavin-dependent oxidoreductase (nitroreductase family)
MEAEDVLAALRRNRTMDITTIGAKTGLPRRIEIWAWPDGDRLYLTGSPGRRDWYANLRANPDFTLHLRRGIRAAADLRAPPAGPRGRVDGGRTARGGRPLVLRHRPCPWGTDPAGGR